MLVAMKSFKASVLMAVRRFDVNGLCVALDSTQRQHSGTASAIGRQLAICEIVSSHGNVRRWASALSRQASPSGCEVAIELLRHFSLTTKDSLTTAVAVLCRCAEHENWEVREYAAGGFGWLLDCDFRRASRAMAPLVKFGSSRLKRAIAVGVKYAAKSRIPGRIDGYLDLLQPILGDPDIYVRRNLGPFAIGDGVLRCFPADTLRFLKANSKSEDENVRWNVAMAFSTAEGAKHVDDGLAILATFIPDSRLRVQRGIAAAMKGLAKKHPEHVEAVMKAWKQPAPDQKVKVMDLPRQAPRRIGNS